MIYVIAAIAAFFLLKKKPIIVAPVPHFAGMSLAYLGTPSREHPVRIAKPIERGVIGEAAAFVPGRRVGDQNDPEPITDPNADVSFDEMVGYVETGFEIAEAVEEGVGSVGDLTGWW